MIRPKQPHKKCQFERPVAKYDETTAFCKSKQETKSVCEYVIEFVLKKKYARGLVQLPYIIFASAIG